MTIDAVLNGLISALAGEESNHSEHTSRTLGYDQVLEEIDQTVLPAEFCVSSSKGRVQLRVSGRRLYDVIAASNSSASAPIRSSHRMAIEDKVYAKDVAVALHTVCNSISDLKLDKRPMSSGDFDECAGLSIKMVRKAFTPRHEALLDRFCTAVVNDLTAVLRVRDDTVIKTVGDVRHLDEALETQVPAFLRAQTAAGNSVGEPTVTAFADVLQSGQSLIMAKDRTDMLLASCATVRLAEISGTFQRLSQSTSNKDKSFSSNIW